MSTAIERITGFACKVNEEQWMELVKVADEVGATLCSLLVRHNSKKHIGFSYVGSYKGDLIVGWVSNPSDQVDIIPYPDFLAKLKGDEKWEPKNGEEVEVKPTNHNWQKANYIGMDGDYYVCFTKYDDVVYHGFKATRIRPLRPTMTRKEAEEKLNARIID